MLTRKRVRELEQALGAVFDGKPLGRGEAHDLLRLVEYAQMVSQEQPLRIGSKVRGTFGRRLLYCGSGLYPYAIVISLDPFILVSQETDMRWTCVDREDFEVIGQASWFDVFWCKWKRGKS